MKKIHLAAAAALTVLALSGCVAPPQQDPTYGSAPAALSYASYCAAGVYQCPVPAQTPIGTSCACPALGAPSYGVAR